MTRRIWSSLTSSCCDSCWPGCLTCLGAHGAQRRDAEWHACPPQRQPPAIPPCLQLGRRGWAHFPITQRTGRGCASTSIDMGKIDATATPLLCCRRRRVWRELLQGAPGCGRGHDGLRPAGLHVSPALPVPSEPAPWLPMVPAGPAAGLPSSGRFLSRLPLPSLPVLTGCPVSCLTPR